MRRKNDAGEYSFNLTAANAEKILASERYATRSSAEGGIEAVKANAEIDARYERKVARDGSCTRAEGWGPRSRVAALARFVGSLLGMLLPITALLLFTSLVLLP